MVFLLPAIAIIVETAVTSTAITAVGVTTAVGTAAAVGIKKETKLNWCKQLGKR